MREMYVDAVGRMKWFDSVCVNSLRILLCFFWDGQSLLARHGRELIEKLVQRLAALQTVEQIPDRHASAVEDGSAPEFFRVCFNQILTVRHTCFSTRRT
jgi:hypothetical protein